MAAIQLDQADGDEEIGSGQAEVPQRIPGGKVAVIRCQESDQAFQRALRDGPCLRRRRDVAGDNLGEDLDPRPYVPRGLPLPGDRDVGLDALVGEGAEGVGDDVGDGVAEAEADAGVKEARAKHWDALQRQRVERLRVVSVHES